MANRIQNYLEKGKCEVLEKKVCRREEEEKLGRRKSCKREKEKKKKREFHFLISLPQNPTKTHYH